MHIAVNYCMVLTLSLASLAKTTHADTVYEFHGAVTAITDPFGTGIQVSDPISGVFGILSAATDSNSDPADGRYSNGGFLAGVNIVGHRFEMASGASRLVIVDDGGLVPPIDQFFIRTTPATSPAGVLSPSSSMTVGFVNESGFVFNSDTLPSFLNLADFDSEGSGFTILDAYDPFDSPWGSGFMLRGTITSIRQISEPPKISWFRVLNDPPKVDFAISTYSTGSVYYAQQCSSLKSGNWGTAMTITQRASVTIASFTMSNSWTNACFRFLGK